MKKIIIPTAILFALSLGLGLFGFYLSQNKEEDTNYKISYKYFINGEESKNMPEESDGYEFDKYKCTNGVTGKWSEKKWKFTPKKTANSTCRIYFVDREYEIELIAPDGVTISGDEKVNVKKDGKAEFTIAPKEGVAIKEVTCTNDQKAIYANDKVTIDKPTDDATCTIVTEDAKYTVQAAAISGKVTNSQQEAKFGQNVIFNVTPNAGYILDKVTCTNNQNGTWSNGKLTISKLTASTKCTVSFRTNQYSVRVNATGATPTTSSKTITANGTVTFSIVPTVENAIVNKISCTNGQTATWSNNSLKVANVKANTVCTVSFKQRVETTG